MDKFLGGVKMRKVQIYIEKRKKEKITLSWGGGGRLSILGGTEVLPPP